MGNKVYAVVVEWKGDSKVSQDAFSNLIKAQAFIETRLHTPTQVTPMLYEDKRGMVYKILELLVK